MVGRLNGRSVFDPRFQNSFGVMTDRTQTSVIRVRRATGTIGEWNYDTGKRDDTGFVDIWRSMSRVQPNKDWRSRGYEFGDESTVFQAVRFQWSLVEAQKLEEKGYHLPTGWLTDEIRDIRDEDQIVIEENYFKNLDNIKNFVYTIRNPLTGSNAPLQNVLTDVSLKGVLNNGDS